MRDVSSVRRRIRFGKMAAQSAGLAVAVLAAGCSADVARFDSTSFAFNDPAEGDGPSPPPVPTEPVYQSGFPHNAVARSTPPGPYNAGAESVDVAQLPAPAGAAPAAMPFENRPSPPPPSYAPQRFAATSVDPVAAEREPASHGGEQIQVQPGDTLYGLSKRHRVPLADLMSANNLSGPNLKPGQRLTLPGGASAGHTAPSARIETAAVTPAEPVSADVMQKYGAEYTVKPGDSLYAIAKTHGANYAELQRVNGVKDVRKVRPGTVLKVPGTAPAAAETIAEAPNFERPAPRAPATFAPPSVINGPKVAALDDKATDASPEAPAAPKAEPKADRKEVAVVAPQATQQAGDSVKLRWPAQGKVIAGFGGRPDGTHNDGINVSVPLGTDVHAAESGVVAYAGSELKGYGNLILIRHDNGWVTAYAHCDELLVKRGDKIKRGQVVAKAGKTGAVDQPQVHFELRQGSKPVDPTPFMEKS
ncbi:MAG: peptidoglycan DD-metalloendopeptidase family protein [Hyphomicrobium sp.]